MSTGRLISALFMVVVLALGLTAAMSACEVAFADSGSGSGSAVLVATGSGSGSGSGSASVAPALPSPDAALATAAEAFHKKDWFLLTGCALSLVIFGVRWLLAKKWPKWEEAHWGVILAAAISGATALAIAWYTEPEVDTGRTAVGAFKLFAYAAVVYVAPRKLLEGARNTGTASSSDVPAP